MSRVNTDLPTSGATNPDWPGRRGVLVFDQPIKNADDALNIPEAAVSDELFAAAREAMRRAHAPYSKFPVGAAILTTDGRVYAGANIEVVSFPEGWCAETTALSHFVMAGGGEIAEVAVVAEKMDLITPCGGCRQRLAEFAGPETKLHLCDQNGIAETVLMKDMLPRGFDTEVLG